MRRFQVEIGAEVIPVSALDHAHAAEKALKRTQAPIGDTVDIDNGGYSRVPGQDAVREYRVTGYVVVEEVA